MGNILLAQNFTELEVVVEANVPITGAKDDFHVPEVAIVGVGHEVYRVVEIDIVIIIAVHERLDVKSTAEAEEVTHHLRMTERKVAGTEATETNPTASHASRTGIVPDLWHEFFRQEFIVLDMPQNPKLGVYVSVPTGIVDAVGAKNLYEASFYEPTNRFQHPPIFSFIVAAQGGGKDNQRITMSAERENFYVVAQVMAVEFGVCFLHWISLLRER